MTAFIVLIACSIFVAAVFLIGFLISVRRGQFDDTYTPSVRVLFDDEVKAVEKEIPVTPNNTSKQ